jgi:hypothetical protein
MSDMNSALSVWQLAIIIVIPLALLCGWIITIFMVAREPREPSAHAAAASSAAADSSPADEAAGATVGGRDQPTEPPARRLAA